jgi:hypothetical protein
MPELKAPLVYAEGQTDPPLTVSNLSVADNTSQLQFNNKVYARAPSCRDLVPPEITVSPAPGQEPAYCNLGPEGNIYEELQRRRLSREDRPASAEQEGRQEEESYDHLNFTRPSQELRQHYQSTDTLRSSPTGSQSRPPSGGSDFTSNVLSSVENLGSMTRRTIYEAETDSGVSSGQSTVTTGIL